MEVNRKTVGLLLVAVTSLLSNIVVAVISDRLHPTAAHAVEWWEGFRAVSLAFAKKTRL